MAWEVSTRGRWSVIHLRFHPVARVVQAYLAEEGVFVILVMLNYDLTETWFVIVGTEDTRPAWESSIFLAGLRPDHRL